MTVFVVVPGTACFIHEPMPTHAPKKIPIPFSVYVAVLSDKHLENGLWLWCVHQNSDLVNLLRLVASNKSSYVAIISGTRLLRVSAMVEKMDFHDHLKIMLWQAGHL